MTRTGYIVLGSSLLLFGILSIPVSRAVQRGGIRKRLEEEYEASGGGGRHGGIDDLEMQGAFDTDLYKRSNKATITLVEARERAKQVYDNYDGWWVQGDDDEDAIISAFSGLGHLHDVSKIADQYQQYYGDSLHSIINKALDNESQKNRLKLKLSALPNE